jgi:septum formation protein
MELVLASGSPRRAELLASAGFSFRTLAVDVDERVGRSESPDAYVLRIAAEKSARGLEKMLQSRRGGRAAPHDMHGELASSGIVVIGADTAVVADDRILGKPADDAEARAMLKRLSGRVHHVLTGVSGRTTEREVSFVDRTSVWFAPLTSAEIEWYVATGEGRDKAGAYGIQGRAARFIVRIDGSYSNVVGLPIAAVYALLGQIGR